MRATLLLALAPLAFADDPARPRHNGAYVRDDVASVTSLAADARQAAEANDAATAADRLDAMLLTEETGLVPIREHLLYVSPRRWAHLQLLSGTPPFGEAVLKAWRDKHDGEANAALRGAVVSGDEAEVLRLLDRYPAATEAPFALLALSDRALQRADPDEADGFLLRVREHVAPAEETLLASDGYRRRQEFLKSLGPRCPPGWPTEGGDPSRARSGDPLPPPERMKLLWKSPFLDGPPPSVFERERDRSPEVSPVLPFPPVCDEEHVFVHLGPAVAAFSRATGKLDFFAPEGAGQSDDPAGDVDRERMVDELLARSPGGRAVTVADGVLYFDRTLPDPGGIDTVADNELVAFDLKSRKTLWRITLKGEGTKSRALPVFFRGAPAVVGDRIYVYGAVRDKSDDGPTPKEEAHVFCLDRRGDGRRGKVLWRRFLGYGDTDAPAQFPPFSGLSPAVAKGVVVVVTGLGVAAAMDARSGDLLWLFRYDRRPVRERERLTEDENAQMVHLRSGWMREPPRIVGDSVYFAPFDAEELYACWLRGARTPAGFEIEQWAKDRAKGHRHSLLEYIGGVKGGRIWCVGRRDPRPALSLSYQAVVSWPLDRAVGFAYGLVPHAEKDDDLEPMPPEIYGNPTIAGDVLLVPTRRAIYRFDAGKAPQTTLKDGERLSEIPVLPPYLAAPDGDEEQAAFGALVAVDGFLYVTTTDKILCYGEEK